ncbi:tRNA/rRNA methyltransferase (SpoU) [Deinococcus maricopensis DSM 21211]|uniref:Putative tRNA (cytidine(34)-2'-O)-methyltransferase n=1 Tax=Deinococcus maricopensis (strain DSM 21211 / LMG 22137 / NRRL B-23946 / LB-34) TaxID=709986 RepID=E8UBQ7_DEIML|nr:tRNA/rRNA methyltransferase (SpoU) [Deinococcus maricopensis DSM 21211]
MLHLVLYTPEKAGNVGNVARTCAVLGAHLHLIRPYGFHLQDREFRRAVMDYLSGVTLHEHASWTHFQASLPAGAHVTAFSTRATHIHTTAPVSRGMYLLFGPESRGLPDWLLSGLQAARIPQPAGGRSLNLSVAAGIAAYEAARRLEGW